MILMPGLKGKYDAWNRLIEVKDSNDNLIATYEYNGLNQRIKKTVGATVTKSFFNENWQEFESITNNQVTSYIWGLRYIDDLVLREKGEERLYSLADSNWNVVAVCDSTGSVMERMKYDAFGKITWLNDNFSAKNSSDYDWNRTFTGQVIDVETGLMLYRMRYYDVTFGRFVNRDPIVYEGDDVNIYRYVFNISTIMVDSLGLKKGYPIGPTTQPTTKPTTTMPKRWPIRLPPTTTKCIPMAGGCGVADGPAPFGDIIGGGVLVCVLIYDIYVCTRPDPLPPPVSPKPPRCPKDDEDDDGTCAKDFPGLPSCSNYKFKNATEAAKSLGAHIKTHKMSSAPAKDSNCQGGTHYNIYKLATGKFEGSVICCPCCVERDIFSGITEAKKSMGCNAQ